MVFEEIAIRSLYEKSLAEASMALASLSVAEGVPPRLRGLNGWVFEKTIRYCLARELEAVGLAPDFEEQVPITGRARVDLTFGKVAIELKAGGSFGAGDEKYRGYRNLIEGRGQSYLYLSLQESHIPYRLATKRTFGAERTFYLEDTGDWARFVQTVMDLQT